MKNIKKILRFDKLNGIFYGERNKYKFVFASIKLNANSDLYIDGEKWLVKGKHIFPSIIPYIYESVYSFEPKKYNQLQLIDNEFIRILVLNGKNINVIMDGKVINKHNKINFINAKDLLSFVRNYNYNDYITE